MHLKALLHEINANNIVNGLFVMLISLVIMEIDFLNIYRRLPHCVGHLHHTHFHQIRYIIGNRERERDRE